jgi:glycosyltransferase involved in cell wall biosynthesis
MLTGLGEVCVITRANNRAAIEAALPSVPEAARLRFEYVDLPAWARWWKRGQRGVRLYYLLWLMAALRRARSLHRQRAFDLVWHLTLANAWLGTTAGLVGPRFVYGPVGGGVTVPLRLFPALGVRGIAYEVVRGLARFAGRFFNPLARVAWRRASVILVQNPETQRWLPRRYRGKAVVFPNALATDVDGAASNRGRERSASPVALFAGRLLPWKGLSLALCALALLPGWRFIVLGSGPDLPRLCRLARRYGVAHRVEFRGWQPRDEVLRVMRDEADAFLFPSLHDEAGLAIAEALACGLPVVCLDHGGPPVVARALRAHIGQEVTSNTLAHALRQVSQIPAVVFMPPSDDCLCAIAELPAMGPCWRSTSSHVSNVVSTFLKLL